MSEPHPQKVPEIRIECPDSLFSSPGDLSTRHLLENDECDANESAELKVESESCVGELGHIPMHTMNGRTNGLGVGGGGGGGGGSFHSVNSKSRFGSFYLEPEYPLHPYMNNSHNKLNLPRQSIISRQSVGLFLDSLPHNETEYANQEVFSAVREIISTDIGLTKQMDTKEKMRVIIRSHKFHLFNICLIILDCFCVLLQMLLDLFVILDREAHYRMGEEERRTLLCNVNNNSVVAINSNNHIQDHSGGGGGHKRAVNSNGGGGIYHNSALHSMELAAEGFSLFILSIFLLSILCHLVLLGKVYCRSKLEVFDALIVIFSFSFEIISIVKSATNTGLEFTVIAFRFWRIIRIANAIVITVEKRVYRKLDGLKSDIRFILDENVKMEDELAKRNEEVSKITHELDDKSLKLVEVNKRLVDIQAECKKRLLKSEITINGLRNDLKKKEDENFELRNRAILKLDQLNNNNNNDTTIDYDNDDDNDEINNNNNNIRHNSNSHDKPE